MRMELVLSGIAVVLQIAAFIIWTTLMGRLERWIFWTAWIGFFVVVLHRLVETMGWFGPLFGHVTAILFSIVALIASHQTRLLVIRREVAKDKLLKIQRQLATIQAEAHESLALKLAQVLVQLKEQLNYYEAQAKDAGIPTFEESSGSQGKTLNQSGGA